MGSTHIGMGSYERLLQDSRINGKPIGPTAHEYSSHRQKYEARQANREQLAKAREAKHVKGELKNARKSIQSAMDRISARTGQADEATRLRAKHAQLKQDKIAAGYKVEERNPKARSKGNGL